MRQSAAWRRRSRRACSKGACRCVIWPTIATSSSRSSPARAPRSFVTFLPRSAIRGVEAALTPRVLEGSLPLRDLADDCDQQFTLQPGTSLAIVRHILANGRWRVNMASPIQAPKRLKLTGVAESDTLLREVG